MRKKAEAMMLPLEKAMEIQKALKPLGYAVHGYRDSRCSGNGLVTIDLRPEGTFPFRKDPNILPDKEDESEKRLREALEAGYGTDDSGLSIDGISESFKLPG
jgi:hypothetical protein